MIRTSSISILVVTSFLIILTSAVPVNGSISDAIGPSCTPAGTPYVLYDQGGLPGDDHASASQNFQTELDEYDCELADDFEVPSGQWWTVQKVVAYGRYLFGPGPATSFNVTFYDASMIAVTGGTFRGASYTYGNSIFTITLPSSLVLTSGQYYVSLQPTMNTNPYPHGQWLWFDRVSVSGNPAMWRNPGGGFGISQCTDWGKRVESCGIDPGAPDQLFKIVGTSKNGNCATPTPSSTATPTNTATNTATATPTNTPISTLGNYADRSISLSTNTTITPASTPTNTASLSVSTDTNFNGKLEGDPATGVVRVTNAHPAGTYLITVRAFDSSGSSTSNTFTLTVTTPPACNSVGFASAVNYDVGTFPSSVAVGDFNRDGLQDLVVINAKTDHDNVSILLGTGNGNFLSATNLSLGDYSNAVVVGDFNGDGRQDLAVANGASVSILFGDGDGGFGEPTKFSGYSAIALATGDFNSDGRQDLAAAEFNNNRVNILLGDGAGSFGSAINVAVGHNPRSIVVGDFNNDGKHDLAAFSQGILSYNNIIIILGDGAGNFVYKPWVDFGFASQGMSIALGDFNSDGNQDLIGTKQDGTVTLALGYGTGDFNIYNSFSGGSGFEQVAIGDLDRNGAQDLAIADINNRAALFLGHGDGSFGDTVHFGTAAQPVAIAIGDFNDDRKQDLVLTNLISENISVLLSNCAANSPTPTPTITPSISGTITYGNAIGPPAIRPVSDAVIRSSTGSPALTTLTNAAGQYLLTGFGSGSYTVVAAKSGGANNITSFDAAKIAQHVAGIAPLIGNQSVVADVSGNGSLSSFDAALVARYVVGLTPYGSTGTWKMLPESRTYPFVASNIADENYSALLMGEVSGNWTNTGSRQTTGFNPNELSWLSGARF